MRKLEHCMIDLETTSKWCIAGILSIGAVKFNTREGVTDRFYRNVQIRSLNPQWYHFDPSTIEFWKDNPEAWAQLKKDAVPLKQALQDFCDWYGSKSIPIWSHGAAYDIPVLDHALRREGFEPPYKYWDAMCNRTVMNLFTVDLRKVRANQTAESGTHHNAEDDAAGQADNLIQFVRFFEEMEDETS